MRLSSFSPQRCRPNGSRASPLAHHFRTNQGTEALSALARAPRAQAHKGHWERPAAGADKATPRPPRPPSPAGFALLGGLAHQQRRNAGPLVQAILHHRSLKDLILSVQEPGTMGM